MKNMSRLLAGLSTVILLSVLPLVSATAVQNTTNPRLVDAVQRGDLNAIRELLQNHADVNLAQPDGSTALILAADRDDLIAADLLIGAGADVNAVNEYGATALSVACTRGNLAMIRNLLEAQADPNAALLSGETPLMTAVDKGNLEAVRALLEHGAHINAKENRGDQTALMWAVANAHSQIVKLLVEHGADVHARSKGDFSPLLFAAQQGDVAVGRTLLEAAAEVNEFRISDGMTALMVAAAGGHNEFAVLLLSKDANPDMTDERGQTALHYAAPDPKRVGLVQALLAHGADPNARTTNDSPRNNYAGISLKGATPLFLAASVGNVETVRALIAGRADPFMTTDGKTAPLHVATGVGPPLGRHYTAEMKKNSLEITKLLVELGADINAAGEHRWTALHGAAYMGIDSVVQFLVTKGAAMDVFDEYGQTPLSIANAVITVGINDHYFQSSRIVRQSTADLLLKLGAAPLLDSGVQILKNFYKQQ
jgi:ankyrin repeat protein